MGTAEFVQKSPVEKFFELLFQNCFKGVNVLTPEQQKLLGEKIAEALGNLSYHEREIIKLRCGLGDGHFYSLEDVSKMFSVTRERVRQIECKGIMKLKNRRLGEKIRDGAKEIGLLKLAENIESVLPVPVSLDLDNLSVRAKNKLAKAGVFNLDQLVEKTKSDIRDIFLISSACLKEVEDLLAERGLKLKGD